MLLSEQTAIESEKNHFQEIKLLNENILDLKRKLKEVLEKVSLLSDEINNFASRTDMITLQRYIEFWQPMDFVTRKEVNNFLRKKFGPKNKNKQPEKKEIKESKKQKIKEKPKTPSIEEAYPDTD